MLGRVLRGAAWVAGVAAAVVAAEIVLAHTRRYLPGEPRLNLDGEFGRGRRTPLSFAVLGDSTSAGVGAGGPEDAYPTIVAKRLTEALGRRVRLTNFAISGARVAGMLALQAPRAEGLEPDLVFVQIGGNDVTHLTALPAIRRDVAEALDRLLATGATVVAAGPAGMRCRAFLEPLRSMAGARGWRVAGVIEEAARERGVPVVPLAEKTADAIALDAARYFSADGFHPGPGGYAVWADAITPVLLRAMSRG